MQLRRFNTFRVTFSENSFIEFSVNLSFCNPHSTRWKYKVWVVGDGDCRPLKITQC